MTRLTLSAAARICGCHRRTLQRAVQAGRLTLDASTHCVSRDALVAAGYLDPAAPHETPHETPQITPQMRDRLDRLTTTMQQVVDRLAQLEGRLAPHSAPHDTPHVTSHAAPVPQSAPHGTPQVQPHATPMTQDTSHHTPQVTPQKPATPDGPTALPPHIMQVAAIAARYDKLSLRDLAQLLYDRDIYRATDRQGAAVPVNRGTLTRWINQARAAGVL